MERLNKLFFETILDTTVWSSNLKFYLEGITSPSVIQHKEFLPLV